MENPDTETPSMEVTPTQAPPPAAEVPEVNPAFSSRHPPIDAPEPAVPVLIPEPVPVPAHLEAAAALVTPDSIVAATENTRAPSRDVEASIVALERRVAKLESDHFDFFDRVKSAFGGKL